METRKVNIGPMVCLALAAVLQVFWGGGGCDVRTGGEAHITVKLKPGDSRYPIVAVRVNQERRDIAPLTGTKISTKLTEAVLRDIDGRQYMGLLVEDRGWQVLGLAAKNEETPGVAHVRIESGLPVILEVLFLAEGAEPPAKVERRLPAGKYQLKIDKSGEVLQEGR